MCGRSTLGAKDGSLTGCESLRGQRSDSEERPDFQLRVTGAMWVHQQRKRGEKADDPAETMNLIEVFSGSSFKGLVE